MNDLYIGLISGTSMDGIDAALVEFGDSCIEVVQTHKHDYQPALRAVLLAARAKAHLSSVDSVPSLHKFVGEAFRDAALELIELAGVNAADVRAIGSHGQTLRHEPDADPPYSLQVGDPAIIAQSTGIATVADFRRADIELGGQGAPLTPAFHEWLLRRDDRAVAVVNIGGIANVTLLPCDAATTGYDTGPGNTLLDAWIMKHKGLDYDRDGAWAATGRVDDDLLRRLLADPYFHQAAPKSTGFEYFHLDWLKAAGVESLPAADIQATLSQLTAESIAAEIVESLPHASDVLICGGGVHNVDLMRRLAAALPNFNVQSSAVAGLDPDWVEAAAFAWLAMRTINGQPGNLPAVTGAAQRAVLGVLHEPA